MMNLFFASICMYLAYNAVDSSFSPVKYNVKLNFPESITNQKQIDLEDNTLLEAIIIAKKIKELESNKIIKKAEKFITKKQNLKKITSVYKAVDFTPTNVKVKKAEIVKTSKKSFLQFKKIVSTATKVQPTELIIKKKDAQTKVIKSLDLELSYTEIPEQGKFEIRKLHVIAWSEYSIDFKRYSDIEKSKIAKDNNERISIAAAAPEKSKVSNNVESDSMNFTGSTKKLEFQKKDTEVATLSKKEPKEELVFFDYESEKKDPVKEVREKVVPDVENDNVREEVVVSQNNRAPAIDPLDIQQSIVASLVQPKNEIVAESNSNKSLDEVVKAIKEKSKIIEEPKIALVNKEESVQKNEQKTDEIKNQQNGLLKTTNTNYACMDANEIINDETYNTKYILTLTGIEYSDAKYNRLRNFEVRFHDDTNESKKDYGNGQIDLSFKMNTQMSIRKATFVSRGYYPTTTDLVFESGELKADIPVFSLSSFDKILQDNNLRGLGGHLLVELDEKTEDVELDKETEYEAKLYLNKQFKVVSRSSYDYNFVLFVGAKVGNSVITFRNNKDEQISKLIHLAGDEIYYEPNFYAEVEADEFAVYEERLLSKCKAIKNIDISKIEPWSYPGKISKDALNRIDVKNMIYPLGTRKYFEFKHLEESVFVGRWSEENVVIPSEEYINHVISKFNLNQSQSKCLVQLNFSKPIRNISYNGLSGINNMNIQIQVLDKDGQFYDSFSGQSERAFLMGENTGVLSVKIDYADGSSQFLQSYCSENTYLVEQL